MYRLLPLSEVSSTNRFSNVRLVATDMDGTLTKKGKFTTELLQSLQDLATAGIEVVIVTGRSAGWVSGLAYYLPIVGAIAENGGLFFFGGSQYGSVSDVSAVSDPPTPLKRGQIVPSFLRRAREDQVLSEKYCGGSEKPVALTPIPDLVAHRQQLASAFQQLQTQFPHIQESADNRFRVTDWTFDVQGLSTDEVKTLSHLCEQMGWGFTYSNVQCHIKPLGQDKAIGLLQALREYFPQYIPEQVVTVGDSPNDESLFDERYFPLSVGVANVLEYANKLQHQPAYVTSAAEGEGFCELARMITEAIAAGGTECPKRKA